MFSEWHTLYHSYSYHLKQASNCATGYIPEISCDTVHSRL
jgi:hypothetical protein